MDTDFKRHIYFSESMRRKNIQQEFNNVRGQNSLLEIKMQKKKEKKREKEEIIRAS